MQSDPLGALRASFSPAGLLYQAHLRTVVEAQQTANAAKAGEMLIKALPGFDLAEHVDASSLDRDGLLRVINNQETEEAVADILTQVRKKGHAADLPFNDLDSWIALCDERQIGGPGNADAQRALASDLLSPLIAILRAPMDASASARHQPGGAVEERLARLKALEENGLVTTEEASDRRKAILKDL